MFEKKHSIELPKLYACADACSYSLKRIKYQNDGTLLVLENNYTVFNVFHIAPDGTELKKWTVSEPDGLLVDYIYINDIMYMNFVNSVSDYEEILAIYRSDKGEMQKVTSLTRESYQHDMDYFSMFRHNDECRLLVVRHNRVHLYIIGDTLHELQVLEGGKWFISGKFVANSMGREWELYDSSLDLVNLFRFEEDVEWVSIEASADSNIIAMATDSATNEIGGLYVYDKVQNDYKVHYQRYGFYHISVCYGKVWASVASMYSDIGGLMIFDKTASLKFAHLRDEKDPSLAAGKTYQPAPLVYQAQCIMEVPDGAVLFADNDKMVITDATCHVQQEMKQQGYDCFSLSADGKVMVVINFENRLLGNDAEIKYGVTVDFYEWSTSWKKAFVVDLATLRK